MNDPLKPADMIKSSGRGGKHSLSVRLMLLSKDSVSRSLEVFPNPEVCQSF